MIRRKMSIPVIALLLGLGIVTTQSAFKSKTVAPNWGISGSTTVSLAGKTLDNSDDPAPGTYSCRDDGNCAGFYNGAGQPTPGQLTDIVDGVFSLN